MLKRLLIRILFSMRLLSLYHRVRNRNALTVISLHRVLSTQDPRWRTCDPLYTISDSLFEQCLRFLAANYSVISLDQLAQARLADTILPPRPLLITFDDGWADNHEYALPILRQLGLPAALFVAASAIDSHDAFFQERLIAGWRTGRLDKSSLQALWHKVGTSHEIPPDPSSEEQVRVLIGRLQKVSVGQREEILAGMDAVLHDVERQMLTSAELRELHACGFGIGTHGNRHEPLTAAQNVDAELTESKQKVANMLGVESASINSLSFPFSKQNASVVECARTAGYELLFGGGQTLTPIAVSVPALIARVGITSSEVCDLRGNLLPHLLAMQLFRQPHCSLAAG